MNCKNTRSCCSPYSVLAQQLEETTERAIQAYNLAVQGLRNPVNENLTINGDLLVNGDIFQYGAAYETHAEKVYTNDDYIVMRDDAVSGLAAGDYSGFQVTKYDGTNDGRLVIDKDGTARVGDVNDEQPLATRDESADLTDGHLVKWDAANLKLTDAGISPAGMMELYDENSYTSPSTLTPFNQYSMALPMNTGKEFETGYDYVIVITSSDDFALNIKTGRTTETPGNTTFSIQMQAGEVTTPTFVYAVYRFANGGNAPTVNLIGSCSVKLQTKLVSGTNIKTVSGQSLLGSGDVPAGGLTWTLRTANNDWTDIFEYASGKITAKKNLYLYYSNNGESFFIPKGASYTSSFYYSYVNRSASGGNTIPGVTRVSIDNKITSNYSYFTTLVYKYTITTDGTNITVTQSVDNSGIFSKSNFLIYTAD